MNLKPLVVLAVLLWLAAALQQGLAPRLAFFGARPDFLILATAAFVPFASRRSGAVTGAVAGLLHGALAGANVMYYVISRAIAGFAGAWMNELRFAPNFLTIALTTAAVTAIAHITLMFLVPPTGIASYLAATILSAVYNGVLVWPLYALLRRVLDPIDR